MLASGNGFRWTDIALAAGFFAGAFLMRGAGCTWNDIVDRRLDAKVARTRTRPIPSGQVSVKQAAIWMVVQSLAALAILLSFNSFAVILGCAALIPALVYPFAKRFTWWPQLFLGIAFNWGALLGWAAHSGELALPSVLLYLGGISWTLFYDTIYAHQDRRDDVPARNRSTALLFVDRTHDWLAGFAVLSVAFLAASVIAAVPIASMSTVVSWIPLALAMAGVCGFALHLWFQLYRLDIDQPSVCLRLFRSNRNAGLIPVAMFLVVAAM